MAAIVNGNWRGWLIGIMGTLVVAAVTNGIVFQRETNEMLAHHEERIKRFETHTRDTIIREFTRLEKRIEELERRR